MKVLAPQEEFESRTTGARLGNVRPSRLPRTSVSRLRTWEVVAVITVVLLVTLGVWWQHGGFSQLVRGGSSTVSSLGQVTGLIAALGALFGITLTSRPGILERRYGLDTLLVAHRSIAIITVSAVVLHVFFATWARSLAADTSFLGALIDLALYEPWMVAALTSAVLFVLIALSSWHVIRHRLSYETWYFLHLLGYLTVALAFGHQVTLGSDFVGDPFALVWWCALASSTVIIVLASRVKVIALALSRRLAVSSVTRDAENIGTITLSGPGIRRIRATAGQYFLMRPLAKGLWWQAHPFSLSAAPTTDGLRFTIKALGDDSREILRIRPGTRVLLEGPYGAFTADRANGMPLVLIGCGVGIAPIRAILEDCSADASPIVIVRVHDETEFVHRSEIESLVHEKGGTLHVLCGPRAQLAPRDPFGAVNLKAWIPDAANRHAFICGPASLEFAVARGLRAAGMKRSQVHFERFDV
ncbi:unannotated protein [freshwater metagenome]|uniref:Unannotated protein n=1 Tax=freshwater metagenome TaxID=449393 RepID=A0A6J7J804_9ZZZZ